MLVITASVITNDVPANGAAIWQGIVAVLIVVGLIVHSSTVAAGVNFEYSTHSHLIAMNSLMMDTEISENLAKLREAQILRQQMEVHTVQYSIHLNTLYRM